MFMLCMEAKGYEHRKVNPLPPTDAVEEPTKGIHSSRSKGEGKNQELIKDRHSANPVVPADAIAQNWLGLRVSSIDDAGVIRYGLLTRSGVLVIDVVSGGASDLIGMHPGDVIRQVNGQVIKNIESFREMVVRAREFPRVQMIVQRLDEGYKVTLKP